ncbi:hypothetical protein NBRC111894_3652 [Sporolactobacillus inulinus]|uniref:Uncharacterized protein n=1 Tax=Sporolactobacillus inulinus TaxID=2078 RepID=A0A4Y1ZIB1_9BACL|nr:hypothetical protein [Sporolactobacillus inulinus]GAY78098.1 hypothetical protein NBRC111894_3652 [Sporolactobacillus inulinus]
MDKNLLRLQTYRPVSWPRIKAEVLWRQRDRAKLMRASETSQIPALSEEARGAPTLSEQSERTRAQVMNQSRSKRNFR